MTVVPHFHIVEESIDLAVPLCYFANGARQLRPLMLAHCEILALALYLRQRQIVMAHPTYLISHV